MVKGERPIGTRTRRQFVKCAESILDLDRGPPRSKSKTSFLSHPAPINHQSGTGETQKDHAHHRTRLLGGIVFFCTGTASPSLSLPAKFALFWGNDRGPSPTGDGGDLATSVPPTLPPPSGGTGGTTSKDRLNCNNSTRPTTSDCSTPSISVNELITRRCSPTRPTTSGNSTPSISINMLIASTIALIFSTKPAASTPNISINASTASLRAFNSTARATLHLLARHQRPTTTLQRRSQPGFRHRRSSSIESFISGCSQTLTVCHKAGGSKSTPIHSGSGSTTIQMGRDGFMINQLDRVAPPQKRGHNQERNGRIGVKEAHAVLCQSTGSRQISIHAP